jgi:hypothetical protein
MLLKRKKIAGTSTTTVVGAFHEVSTTRKHVPEGSPDGKPAPGSKILFILSAFLVWQPIPRDRQSFSSSLEDPDH